MVLVTFVATQFCELARAYKKQSLANKHEYENFSPSLALDLRCDTLDGKVNIVNTGMYDNVVTLAVSRTTS